MRVCRMCNEEGRRGPNGQHKERQSTRFSTMSEIDDQKLEEDRPVSMSRIGALGHDQCFL